MELVPGTVIDGRYRLERLLGRGGMGAVYAARHLTLGELYAIKFVSPGPGDRDEAHARFRREARSAALLTSDHVARVIDVGVHGDDELYIVMEHLDGIDLEALARQRGRVPVEEAATYVLQACEALAEAHAKNIVHRDIKPANLFLTTSHGEPLLKVLDFGVSKTLGVDMTQTAAILGSPKYMSPEQMDDPRSVDGRTDVWSLGVVLYRLVAGRLPFEGDTLGRVCMAVMRDPLPALSAASPLPAGFAAIVERCLEKDRDRRFATVDALAAALAPYTSAGGRLADPLDDEVTRLVEPVTAAASVPPGAPPATDFATSQRGVRAAAELHGPSSTPPWRSGLVLVGGALALVTALVGVVTASAVRERQRVAASVAEPPAASLTAPPTPSVAAAPPSTAPIASSVAAGFAALERQPGPPPASSAPAASSALAPPLAAAQLMPAAGRPSTSGKRSPSLAPPRAPSPPSPLGIPEDRR